MPEPTPGIAVKRPAGRGDGKRGRWFDRAAGFGTLLVGSGLLALAVPRTIAAWNQLGAQPALQKLENGQRPSIEELKAGIEALEVAMRWTPLRPAADESGDVRAGARDTTVSRRRAAGKASREVGKPSGRGIVAKSLRRLCLAAAGDRAGLPQVARPENRGAPDGFARPRAQSSA